MSINSLAWCTDIHLDAISESQIAYLAKQASSQPGSIVITGDISTGVEIHRHFGLLAEHATVPIRFVLGNHDYWHRSVAQTRTTIREVCATVGNLPGTNEPRLTYLRDSAPIPLSDRACLIGVDGWCDARSGNLATPVILNDFLFIDDLADTMAPGSVLGWKCGVSRASLHHKLQALASADVALLSRKISKALRMSFERFVIAMHIPPFAESAWHEGQISSPDWQPYFTSLCMGKMLRKVARANPKHQFTVLCGHVHGEGIYQAEENLLVRTGGAEYTRPKVQAIFDVDRV